MQDIMMNIYKYITGPLLAKALQSSWADKVYLHYSDRHMPFTGL